MKRIEDFDEVPFDESWSRGYDPLDYPDGVNFIPEKYRRKKFAPVERAWFGSAGWNNCPNCRSDVKAIVGHNYCPFCGQALSMDEWIRKSLIKDVLWSLRSPSRKAIEDAGYETYEDLENSSPDELLMLKNVGQQAINTIYEELSKHGLLIYRDDWKKAVSPKARRKHEDFNLMYEFPSIDPR